jgi:hypothetical protein
MGDGAGDLFFPQLELWPRPHRTADLSLRFIDLDGREDELDADRIAHTILAAGAPGDGLDKDAARSIARASIAFLRHCGEPEPFPHAVVVQTVERALREMGLGRSARLYVRNQARGLGVQPDASFEFTRWDALLDPHDAARHASYWLRCARIDDAATAEVGTAIGAVLAADESNHATPGLIRERVVTELLRRGLRECAERIARVSISLADIGTIQRGEHDTGAGPSVALAGQATEAYAFARVFPQRVTDACLRGEIRLDAARDLFRLQRISLDLEGVKLASFPDSDEMSAPLTDPTKLARRVSHWTRALAPMFSESIVWRAVNFGYAPMLSVLDEGEFVRAAYALLFETATAESRRDGPRIVLEFSWDAPDEFPTVVTGPDATPVLVDNVYTPARRFFAAALEALAGLAERPTPVQFPAVTLRLSPYFFGAPEAPALLEFLSRIVSARFPIALRYDATASLALDISTRPQFVQIVAQTARVNLQPIVQRSPNLNALLAAVESAADIAIEAHLARHDHLDALFQHRAGVFAPLRERFGNGALLDPNALRYHVALDTAAATTLFDDDRAMDAVLSRVRSVCDRWADGTGRAIELVSEESNGTTAGTDPRESLLAQAEAHRHFAEPAAVAVPRDASLSANAQIAEFIRWAFLYTPCRALKFV